MSTMFAAHSPLAWIAFSVLILALLALDLGLFHRKPRKMTLTEAVWATVAYIAVALCFNAWIYWEYGHDKAIEFLTGYVIEYALSMDNILVFVVILAYFQVPRELQMRVLLFGVLGALVLRGIFIVAGIALINAFEWVVLVLGAFLIFTGIRTMLSRNEPVDLEKSRIINVLKRIIPITHDYHGHRFFARLPSGKRTATPLFLVFVVLNITDVVFAVDSIPAIFAITRDPFIVYTSNVFAILGLRTLYFVLSNMLDKFRYLKFGLSLVLIFIGIKMIYNYPDWLADIPTEWALVVTAVLLLGSIIASVIHARLEAKERQVSTER